VELEVHSVPKDEHSFEFEMVLDPQQMDLPQVLELEMKHEQSAQHLF
jgi:hypothetical protein